MNGQQMRVSVIDPIGPAIEWARDILFRPFDLGRWFIIGFGAWLAGLGEGGGGPNLNIPAEHGGDMREFFVENAYWIIPLVAVLVIVGIALWILFKWLSSRGRFMFLHCVAGNRAEVKLPWRSYREHGNSLFLFRIVLSLIALAVIAVPVVLFILLMIALAGAKSLAGIIIAVVCFVLLIIAMAITFGVIVMFTMDFVVPIMALRNIRCRAAWREFLSLAGVNKGRFALYFLFKIIIGIAIGAIVMGAVCVTCCCAACVFAIPYVGTVALLPILVFERSYSLCYLRQYGPEYDVFAAAAAEQGPPEAPAPGPAPLPGNPV